VEGEPTVVSSEVTPLSSIAYAAFLRSRIPYETLPNVPYQDVGGG
jgi:hypothetical protein